MMTVAHPAVMLPPCAVESPCRAAPLPPSNTVREPLTTLSGGPLHVHCVPRIAAGFPPLRTVGAPGGMIGPPVCGLPPGLASGQVWLSPTRAAMDMSRPQLMSTLAPLIVTLFFEASIRMPDPSILMVLPLSSLSSSAPDASLIVIVFLSEPLGTTRLMRLFESSNTSFSPCLVTNPYCCLPLSNGSGDSWLLLLFR